MLHCLNTFFLVTRWLDQSRTRYLMVISRPLSDCALVIVELKLFLYALTLFVHPYFQSVCPLRVVGTGSTQKCSDNPNWSPSTFSSTIAIGQYEAPSSTSGPIISWLLVKLPPCAKAIVLVIKAVLNEIAFICYLFEHCTLSFQTHWKSIKLLHIVIWFYVYFWSDVGVVNSFPVTEFATQMTGTVFQNQQRGLWKRVLTVGTCLVHSV